MRSMFRTGSDRMKGYRGIWVGCLWMMANPALAISDEETCLLQALQTASPETTVETLRSRCQSTVVTLLPERVPVDAPLAPTVDRKGFFQTSARYERYSLLPHRPTYFLPLSYNGSPNQKPYTSDGDWLNETEIKFQISLKVPVALDLFGDNGDLFIGYTQVAWWQAYNEDISSPFRETNYEPEIFIDFRNDWEVLGFRNSHVQLGFTHQSNGRSGNLSRSWNRVYANVVFERENWLFSIKPWWRIPESRKKYPGAPGGDDNPDIEKYLGYGEFLTLYQHGPQTFSLLLRNNLRSDNKGAVQFDWSFPLSRRLRGQFQYFNGYGESLIDYDDATERISFGIQFSDWLF